MMSVCAAISIVKCWPATPDDGGCGLFHAIDHAGIRGAREGVHDGPKIGNDERQHNTPHLLSG